MRLRWYEVGVEVCGAVFSGVTCLVRGGQDGGDSDPPGRQLMAQSVDEEVESGFRRSVRCQTGKWLVT